MAHANAVTGEGFPAHNDGNRYCHAVATPWSARSPARLGLGSVSYGTLRRWDGWTGLAASSGESHADVQGAVCCASHPVGYSSCTLLGYVDGQLNIMRRGSNNSVHACECIGSV